MMTTMIPLLQTIGWVLAFAILITGLAFLYLALGSAVPAWLRFRGKRVIVCPETGKPAAVEVDAGHAALTALPHPVLRLESCTRWPERKGCGQVCLDQIEASPEDCLVVNMLTRWYQERSCAYCGKPFETIHWHDHKPALLNPDGRTVTWAQVPPEQVPEVLKTHRPVCWNCHGAETFRREHPDLVTDRPRDYHHHYDA